MLRAALDAVPSAAFILSAAGSLVAANVAGKRWLALDRGREGELRSAVRGRPPADLVVTLVTDGEGAFLLVRRELEDRGASAGGEHALRWRFTPREREVLALLLAGHSNRHIAADLAIAERTVESHLSSMFEKAGVVSRAALVARVRGA